MADISNINTVSDWASISSVLAANIASMNGFDQSSEFVPPGSPLLWLKADSLAYSDGDPVALWEDQGVNGYDATQNEYTAQRPEYVAVTASLNNMPSVKFVRANADFMNLLTISSGSSNYTFFFVIDPIAQVDNTPYTLFDTTTGRLVLEQGDGSANFRYYTAAYYGTQDSTDVAQVVTYHLESPSSGALYRSSSAIETGLTYSQRGIGGAAKKLGSNISNAVNFDGYIAEVIIYSSALSAADRNTVISGLETKYGL